MDRPPGEGQGVQAGRASGMRGDRPRPQTGRMSQRKGVAHRFWFPGGYES